MWFLVKSAFWLTLVLAFLPIERDGLERAPQVSGGQALHAARAFATDIAGFCTRQPVACETGRQTAALVSARAEAGARALYARYAAPAVNAPVTPQPPTSSATSDGYALNAASPGALLAADPITTAGIGLPFAFPLARSFAARDESRTRPSTDTLTASDRLPPWTGYASHQ